MYQISDENVSGSVFFPEMESYLEEKKQQIKDIILYDQFENLPNSLPDAEDDSLKFHIIDIGEHTFEIDLGLNEISPLLNLFNLGVTLLIVWGLLWTFFKLNAVILTS